MVRASSTVMTFCIKKPLDHVHSAADSVCQILPKIKLRNREKVNLTKKSSSTEPNLQYFCTNLVFVKSNKL